MTELVCTNCRQSYPSQGAPYRCPVCGGLYDFDVLPGFDPQDVGRDAAGIWRYRRTFALPEDAPEVTLGEGATELAWREVFGRRVAFKLEFQNPTGSYKDRGAAVLVSFLRSRRISAAVEDSSGNAGAAFAAYARQTGIGARLFVPDSTSSAKRAQIESYGAELIRVLGPRSNAAGAALRAVEQGAIYASHAYQPYVLPGYATIAYELFEQVGAVPGAVVAPAGQGNLLLALGRGFRALQLAGLVERLPRLVGVQALACAPLWAVFRYGAAGLGWVSEGETLAEGVCIKHPVRGDAVLEMVKLSNGAFVAVEEEDILPGRDQLSALGFNVEPTSAIVWSALAQIVQQLPDPVVVVLTGAGFKAP
jgi:threonine synthase